MLEFLIIDTSFKIGMVCYPTFTIVMFFYPIQGKISQGKIGRALFRTCSQLSVLITDFLP